MKSKFAAVAAAITLAVSSIAIPAEAEAGGRHERQWRQQQQQQHHHRNNHRRDRGSDVGAVLGGMALGIIIGEVINQGQGGRGAPVIVNPPHGGGYGGGGYGVGGYGGYGRHQERCENMQEQLNRNAYNMGYDGIDRQDARQIERQMQRMRDNGCRPYRPF